MNWYLQNGEDSDVVVSSRIRLARNIEGIPFTPKCRKEDLKKVYDLMKEAIVSFGYGLKFFDLKDIDTLTKQSLAEKRIISPDFAKNNKPYSAIIINDDENICITINEEDHVKIQVYSSGREIETLMELAIEIDQKLEEIIPYSYSKQYGYLTACPTNIGTGLKASVLVHLPALTMTENIRKVLNIVNNLGMSIRGVYGENSKIEGCMYQISNTQTLGITENDIVKNLNLITKKVQEQERVARKYLTKSTIDIEDEIYRDYGILSNARKLNEEETIDLLSNIKLGVDLGIVQELNDAKVQELMLYTKPANLQNRVRKSLTLYEQEVERAKVVKEIINAQ